MNKLNFENIVNNLPDNRVKVDIFEEIDSTNDEAKRISLENEFHLIITEKQSKGRGRHGKTWSSPDSHNIYMTICTQNDLSFAPESLITGIICKKSLNNINKSKSVIQLDKEGNITLQTGAGEESAKIILSATGDIILKPGKNGLLYLGGEKNDGKTSFSVCGVPLETGSTESEVKGKEITSSMGGTLFKEGAPDRHSFSKPISTTVNTIVAGATMKGTGTGTFVNETGFAPDGKTCPKVVFKA